jgi:hypothetical protein
MNLSRKHFLGHSMALLAAGASARTAAGTGKVIQGFDETDAGKLLSAPRKPFSDKKVRVGIAGEGVCSFGSAFGFQNHPHVEVVACTDVDPKRCALLQARVKASKTYPSCEEMIKHAAADRLDAVYIATDAASHARLCVMALEHGLHTVTAVPAVLGKDQLEWVPRILDAARRSGKKVSQLDERYGKRAEDHLYEELAAALGIEKAAVCGRIRLCCPEWPEK